MQEMQTEPCYYESKLSIFADLEPKMGALVGSSSLQSKMSRRVWEMVTMVFQQDRRPARLEVRPARAWYILDAAPSLGTASQPTNDMCREGSCRRCNHRSGRTS